MPIEIVRNDITLMHVDAIVNAANETLLGGGGVDGAIHRAAGPKLLEACRKLNGCRTGDAKITRGYSLPCGYVIHTVGPIWRGGSYGERELLVSCYRNSLALAREHRCKSIAFPLISAGAYGYPKDQALRVATDTIRDFLMEYDGVDDLLVYIVVFDRASFKISGKLYAGISEYIDDHYVNLHADTSLHLRRRQAALRFEQVVRSTADCAAVPAPSLEDALKNMDENFSEMVLRLIDEKGMTDPQCYKRANIDRKLFAKIRKSPGYKPKKPTALALAIALELSLPETRELLMKAGLALSHSDKFDIIVEYFILNGRYDIFEINEALYSFDQPLLGGRSA